MRSTLAGGFWAAVLGSVGLGLTSQLNDLPLPENPPSAPELATPEPLGENVGPEETAVSEPVPAPEPSIELPQAPEIEVPDLAEAAPEADTSPPVSPEATTEQAELEAPEVEETVEEMVSDSASAAIEEPVATETTPSAPIASSEPEPELSPEIDVAAPAAPEAPEEDLVQEPEVALAEQETAQEGVEQIGSDESTEEVAQEPSTIEATQAETLEQAEEPSVQAEPSIEIAEAPEPISVEPATTEAVPTSEAATAEDIQIEIPEQSGTDEATAPVAPSSEPVDSDPIEVPSEGSEAVEVVQDAIEETVIETETAESQETVNAEPATEATPEPVAIEEAPVIVPTPEPIEEPEIAATPEREAEPEIAATPTQVETSEPEPSTPTETETASVQAQPETPRVSSIVSQPRTSGGVRILRPGQDEPASSAEQDVEIADESETDANAPALERYAAAFENPEALPVMSILLLDEGASSDAIGRVSALPFPATVILNPLSRNAAETMSAYRAEGVEVGLQVVLPEGATPIDVEVAFEAAFQTMPEAVVLFSDDDGVAQSSRSATEQIMQVLSADGRGFVMLQRGLGNAERVALQAGVPSATILRDLDGAGEGPREITRALDQAALRARQTGGAVLLARVSDQTLATLAEWGADVPSDQLALGPVSGVLAGTAN